MSKPEWLERVCIERDELQGKVNKLKEFMATTNFTDLNETNKDLLHKQIVFMREYLETLNMRIVANSSLTVG
jgi:hypothetical protein